MPYPTLQTVVGLGLEAQAGTAASATGWIPVASAPKPSDKLKYDQDKGWRGSAGTDYDFIPGVWNTEYSLDTYVFPDTIGYILAGVLGDVAYSGGTNAGSSTTTTAALTAGTSTVVAVTSATGITAGTVLAIDTAATQELATVLSVASNNVTLTKAVQLNHASGVTVQPVTAPFTSTFSLYNGGNFQPPTYTITDWYAANGRQYPGAVFSGVDFKMSGDGLLSASATATAMPSASLAGAKPVASYTQVKPLTGWQGVAKIGGSATGTVLSCDLSVKRKVAPIWVVNGVQTPANIWAADLQVTGKLSLLVNDTTDTALNYYLNNTQPSLDLNWAVGSGATAVGVDWNMNNAAFTVADIDRSKEQVLVDASFTAKFNTTNAGASGGYSPISVVVKNAVSPRTYK
jgi:hypothetical protein